MQVVIKSKKQGAYLRRRGSYSKATWTPDLQEACVLSRKGAEKAVTVMEDQYWMLDTKVTGDSFEILPVLLEVCHEA